MRRCWHRWSLLLLLLHCGSGRSSAKKHPTLTGRVNLSARRLCFVEDLLPNMVEQDGSWGWIEATTEPTYNCSCAFTKARYFCPNLPDDHPRFTWKSKAIAHQRCRTMTVADLAENALPPGYTVMSMGNSHLRQPVEALMCQFSDQIASKEVCLSTGNNITRTVVDGNEACRGMSPLGQEGLLKNGCVGPSDNPQAFLCHDDMSSFRFRNGASWHYQYAQDDNVGVQKSVDDRIGYFSVDPENIDVIVANHCNGRPLTYASLLTTAQRFAGSETLIIWLTAYDGVGKFSEEKMETLRALGVVQVDLSVMMSDPRLIELSCLAVQKIPRDSHYCLPGPPDEISILILRIIWAHFQEQSRR